MVNREREKDLREFDYPAPNPFDGEIVNRLKDPIRRAADLHLIVDRRLWYGEVYKGPFDSNSQQWKEFRTEYLLRGKENSMIRNPYTAIDKNWNPVSISSIPKVRVHLLEAAHEFEDISLWLQRSSRNENYLILAEFLSKQRTNMLGGEFDEGMKDLLRLPTELTVISEILPNEPYNDPNYDKASVEGLLAYNDKDGTRQSNLQMLKLKKSALEIYGEVPLDAKVTIAHPVLMSGFLGEAKRKIVGHNKARAEVAKEAGNHLIQIFPVLLEAKHTNMAPKLSKAYGIRSGNSWDIVHYVQGHEYSHSYNYEEEDENWGSWMAPGRELWAAERAVVLSSTDQFSQQYRTGVVKGYLEFACDDVGDLLNRIKEGDMEGLTPEEIYRQTNEYGVGGAIILRQAARHDALGSGKFNIDKLIDLARERDKRLQGIAMSGNEEEARRFFSEMLTEVKLYPVPEISEKKPNGDRVLV